MTPEQIDDDQFQYQDDDDFEDFQFDCHMDRSGLCGKAGSEECDWECPYSLELGR